MVIPRLVNFNKNQFEEYINGVNNALVKIATNSNGWHLHEYLHRCCFFYNSMLGDIPDFNYSSCQIVFGTECMRQYVEKQVIIDKREWYIGLLTSGMPSQIADRFFEAESIQRFSQGCTLATRSLHSTAYEENKFSKSAIIHFDSISEVVSMGLWVPNSPCFPVFDALYVYKNGDSTGIILYQMKIEKRHTISKFINQQLLTLKKKFLVSKFILLFVVDKVSTADDFPIFVIDSPIKLNQRLGVIISDSSCTEPLDLNKSSSKIVTRKRKLDNVV